MATYCGQCPFFKYENTHGYGICDISGNYECILELNCRYCIPYNEDTKHLVGTTEEAPEYYRYWED